MKPTEKIRLLTMRYTEQDEFKIGKPTNKRGVEIILNNPKTEEVLTAFRQLKQAIGVEK